MFKLQPGPSSHAVTKHRPQDAALVQSHMTVCSALLVFNCFVCVS